MDNLEQIYSEVQSCQNCSLCKTRINAVYGCGSKSADIMFIGEAPGKNEDIKGEPFVGQAGKLLDEMLESIGFTRDDVFITNIVKCRPPNNRDPKDEEKKICSAFLDRQIKLMNPLLIVPLGRHAMNYFLPTCTISKDHGCPKRKNGQIFYPLYHPAAALYNGGLRGTLFEDFKRIPKLLKQIRES